MKKIFVAGLLFLCFHASGQEKLNVIVLKKPADTHEFLRFSAGDLPVIAGHRGTVEDGFPENSLEGMAHTLRFTPAIFEIDPRLTKDSIVVLMHDATLDRTTTGTGKISDYTYADLQKLFLKDVKGNVTPYKIPTLEEVFKWAKGKTIVNLDQKGVPYAMIADLIRKNKAEACVMITAHSVEHAKFYLERNPQQTFSAFMRTREQFDAYEKSGIPFNQLMAYIGPEIKESNQELYRLINGKGAMAMISSASTYDKLPDKAARKERYLAIIKDGASVLETDFPIEVAEALKSQNPMKAPKLRFIKKR